MTIPDKANNDYNKVREAVAEIVCDGTSEWKWSMLSEERRSRFRKVADQILNIEVDGCKVMVVRLEGELPENPYMEHTSGGKLLWCETDKANTYGGAQDKMLKANYYQAIEGGER